VASASALSLRSATVTTWLGNARSVNVLVD
jgi:hypothetical protein